MATAKPKTTKIEAPIEEALQGLSDVLQEEAKVEEVVIAEAVEEALVEEPVAVEAIVEASQAPVEEVTPPVAPFGSQPIWHGAMTGQIHKQRNQ